MQKKDNLITKFRTLWKSLSLDERRDLWDILTALRGSDSGENDLVKDITTARIRGELLGENFHRGFVYLSLADATRNHCFYSWRTMMAQYQAKAVHFRQHVYYAVEALNKYRPKSSMRDLQKFLRY